MSKCVSVSFKNSEGVCYSRFVHCEPRAALNSAWAVYQHPHINRFWHQTLRPAIGKFYLKDILIYCFQILLLARQVEKAIIAKKTTTKLIVSLLTQIWGHNIQTLLIAQLRSWGVADLISILHLMRASHYVLEISTLINQMTRTPMESGRSKWKTNENSKLIGQGINYAKLFPPLFWSFMYPTTLVELRKYLLKTSKTLWRLRTPGWMEKRPVILTLILQFMWII